MNSKKICILGGGITGLSAAWLLAKSFKDRVFLIENAGEVGGLAKTISRNGWSFDTGSHRIHAGYEPEAFALLRQILGKDLLKRERRGLIYAGGKTLPYPPKLLNLCAAFGPARFFFFSASFLKSHLSNFFGSKAELGNFESYTKAKVGERLYQTFYEPYAVKLYGMRPSALSADPAVSRVRRFQIKQVWSDLLKSGKDGADCYYYPKEGTGQIARRLKELFLEEGGQMAAAADFDPIILDAEPRIKEIRIRDRDGKIQTLEVDQLISTVPLEVLHSKVKFSGEEPPPFDIRWRGLRIVNILTRDAVETPHETFYLPESDTLFGRVSELHKYSPYLNADHGLRALSLEIPCSFGDEIWNMADDVLYERCIQELQKKGILKDKLTETPELFSIKMKDVYPVYESGWRAKFHKIYDRLDSIENLYMIGRTALFLHCNMDHCISMSMRLAGHLTSGKEKKTWRETSKDFFDYVVRE